LLPIAFLLILCSDGMCVLVGTAFGAPYASQVSQKMLC
jgi:hypothetical protein